MKTFLCILLSVLRVAFVGDPQVDNPRELEYARKSIYSELRSRSDLDLVVILGDLVNENPSLIAPSEATLDSLACPWVRVNGNHDGPDPKTDTTFMQGGVRFILMNNVRLKNRGGYEGGLRKEQKHWLDSVMRSTPARQKIIFCTHIPVSQSKGLDSLSNIMSSHPDILFVSGHTHMVDRHILERGCEELIAGASCGTWWRGVKDADGIPYAMMNCGSPRGYFTADIRSHARSWYRLQYKAVGRDPKEQYSVHRDDEGRIIVNIYGGSREGRVRVKAGGKWQDARHCYMTAPEAQAIIDSNSSMDRAYRKAHKDEFIPMRNLPSPHIWVLESAGMNSDKIRIRYRDASMRIKSLTRF